MVKRRMITGFLILLTLCVTVPQARADLSQGQTLYVPAYSHIYIGHKSKPYPLTVTLSVRNIDPARTLSLTLVDYYGTEGDLLRHFLKEPLVLKPMASARYVVPMPDMSGGSGANFIVTWTADKKMNPPIVESIMIGTQSQQGISFTSRGQEIF